MNPTPNQVYVDSVLTNFSIALMQNSAAFVAPKVFPVVSVKASSGLFATYPRGAFMRGIMKVRPLGDVPIQIDYDIVYDNYSAEEYAAEKLVDDRVRANSMDPMGPDRGAVKLLTSNAMVFRDRDWAAKYMKTGVWTHEYAGVTSGPSTGTFLRFDQAGSDPIGYIASLLDSMLFATGYLPNVLVLGRSVFTVLANHPQITDRIKYTQRAVVTTDLLAELLGVEKVVVANSVQETAQEGQTSSIAPIVDVNSFWLGYATANPSLDEPPRARPSPGRACSPGSPTPTAA
jgi:hypothetical protein